MLNHEWMRKRERRARRPGVDPQAAPEEDAQAPDGVTPGAEDPAAIRPPDQVEPEYASAAQPVADEPVPPGPEPVASSPDDPQSREAPASTPDDGATHGEEPSPAPAQDAGSSPHEQAQAPTEAPGDAPRAQEPHPTGTQASPPTRPDAMLNELDVPSRSLRGRLEAVFSPQGQLPLDVEARQDVTEKAAGSPRETRQELVQRLLDPTLTLQETATLLGVCHATVRRYTDRGILRCFRTPGNQRRFNLSDVLDFMEHQKAGK